MTTVEYDLDTSGGLMPQIQQVIAPPILEESARRKKERERRYRRPGRAVNHDSCDNCKEGGDLICCDRCPAAFHLTCHDPPLLDDDLPSGEWLCQTCKNTSNADQAAENPSGRSQPLSEQPSTQIEGVVSDLSLDQLLPECDIETTFGLNLVVSNAKSNNPLMFKIPEPTSFSGVVPGTSKKCGARENNRLSKQEIDSGAVHLPAKLCYLCKGNCHRAPLMQCDYCPLLCHIDCLSPPLTSLPNGRWMCPNHAEQKIDQNILTTTSLTRRVKLYDKFEGPVSQDAVKLNFLNKASRRHPPFRFKQQLASRRNVFVPKSIINQYSNPPAIFPRLKENIYDVESSSSWISSLEPTDKQDSFMTCVLSFGSETSNYITCKSTSCLSAKSNTFEMMDCEPAVVENKLNIMNNNLHHSNKVVPHNGPNFDLASTNGEIDITNSECKIKSEFGTSNSSSCSSVLLNHAHPSSYKYNMSSGKTKSVNSSSRTLKNSVKNQSSIPNQCSAPHMFQNKNFPNYINATSEKRCPFKYFWEDKPPLINDVDSSSLKKFLKLYCSFEACTKNSEFEFEKLDAKLLHVLACQRMKQLFPKMPGIENGNGRLDDVRCRAVINSFNKKGPTVAMKYRTLRFGLGFANDVCFASYGFCNYVSMDHALIYYDEITQCYELINYSEFGTIVDNVLYIADTSEIHKPSPHPNSLSAAVRKLAKSSPRMAELPPTVTAPEKPAICARNKEHFFPCACKANPITLVEGNGWESTAVLHHGSLLQFGCLKFAFAVAEYGIKLEPIDDYITEDNPNESSTST